MTFDQLRDKWNSQTDPAQIAVDADLLLKMVRKNKRDFERTIFWRDVREAGGSFIFAPLLIYVGLRDRFWPMFVLALACWFVAAFMVIDRRLQKRKSGRCSQTLLYYAQLSLRQVNHQIWLLRNVFWWYLLPFSIGLVSVFGFVLWDAHSVLFTSLRVAASLVGVAAFWILLYYGIYRFNQWVVKKHLLPCRRDLEQLLENLADNQPTAND